MRKIYDKGDVFEVSFTIPQEEHKEALEMAKEKGYSNVEDLMEVKYQKFMKIHRTNKEVN